jgi:hypothetical protein
MRYREESQGRMAVFLIPSLKLKKRDRGITVEEKIHRFLVKKFGGYTAAAGNIFGYWKDARGRDSYGEHREFKVALRKQELAPVLKDFLAGIAQDIGEECIYLETGDETWFIYPAARTRAPRSRSRA